jgi:hypothetical protein
LPRAQQPGESEPRNYRLLRILKLMGLARGEGCGLAILQTSGVDFRLRWDMLELLTSAELTVQGLSLEIPPPATEAPEALDLGWMPVIHKAQGMFAEKVEERLVLELKKIPETLPKAALPEMETSTDEMEETPYAAIETEESLDQSSVSEVPVEEVIEEEIVEQTDETEEPTAHLESVEPEDMSGEDEPKATEEDKKTSLNEDDGSGANEVPLSPLIQTVRNTPRLQASIVRNSILEFCAEYQSVASLAVALARSEDSLRRRYISPMVKEKLLQMESPAKGGSPDQRYKTAAIRPSANSIKIKALSK